MKDQYPETAHPTPPPAIYIDEFEDDGRRQYNIDIKVSWFHDSKTMSAVINEEDLPTVDGKPCTETLSKLLRDKTISEVEKVIKEMKVEVWMDGDPVEIEI